MARENDLELIRWLRITDSLVAWRMIARAVEQRTSYEAEKKIRRKEAKRGVYKWRRRESAWLEGRSRGYVH